MSIWMSCMHFDSYSIVQSTSRLMLITHHQQDGVDFRDPAITHNLA